MDRDDMRFGVVLTTAGSEAEARAIATALVERRLAACVTRLGPGCSVYRWEGAVREESETVLVVKTRVARFAEVRDAIRELHSYDTPEIVLLPIEHGDPRYLAWLAGETS